MTSNKLRMQSNNTTTKSMQSWEQWSSAQLSHNICEDLEVFFAYSIVFHLFNTASRTSVNWFPCFGDLMTSRLKAKRPAFYVSSRGYRLSVIRRMRTYIYTILNI